MPTASEFEPQLREARLRVTRPRPAALGAVRDDPHADPDALPGVVPADRRGRAPRLLRHPFRPQLLIHTSTGRTCHA